MDVFQLLKEDHKKVKKLFKDYEACGDKAYAQKQKIANTVFNELEIHAQAEEEVFYPAVDENTTEEGQDLIKEAFEEHHVVKILIQELRKMSSQDEMFDAKFTVLRENVEHHIEEEEGELFPKAKKALADEIEEITLELEEKKEELKEELTDTSKRPDKKHEMPIGQ